MRILVPVLLSLSAMASLGPARAEKIGDVNTAFHITGDDKISVEAYDDPAVSGVSCYVSRARIGGLKGAVGVATDVTEASIACGQTGPIAFAHPLPVQEEIFTERMSLLFKKLRVVRMVDARRNTLVYLTYSDKLIDGSPKNSLAVVTVDRGTPIPLK